MDLNTSGQLYTAGDWLPLRLESGQDLVVKIEQELSQTMSYVALVQAESDSLPERMVLKLYDRRTALELRKGRGAQDWTRALEQRYLDAIDEGILPRSSHIWEPKERRGRRFPKLREDADAVEIEAHMQTLCDYMFWDESRAYDLLEDVQGMNVPRLFGRVSLQPSEEEKTTPSDDRGLCLGLLLEYIEGFDLDQTSAHAPPEKWAEICIRSMESLATLREHGIFHKDLRYRCLIIREPDSDFDDYQAFAIDFGICLFAADMSSYEDFLNKHMDDLDEWALPYGMFRELTAEVGDLLFHSSMRVPSREQYVRENGLPLE